MVGSNLPKLSEIFDERYLLISELGAGGLGTVYRARQVDSEREVALKVLRAELTSDVEFVERFTREAKALNLIQHKNIASVYHMGLSAAGLPYIAMEFIDGRSLRQILNSDSGISLSRAIGILRQCCEALSYVHSCSIVHRDIKPENIMVMDNDDVKIIDFGLAKVENFPQSQKLTSTGNLIGSATYMSPEQCRGIVADSRADIYSLTSCFFEMLSGRPAYEADSVVGLVYKNMTEPPPRFNAVELRRLGNRVQSIIDTGMSKDVDSRYQSCDGLLADLEELSSHTENSQEAIHKNTDRFFSSNLGRILVLFFFVTITSFLGAAFFVWSYSKTNLARNDSSAGLAVQTSWSSKLKQSGSSVRLRQDAAHRCAEIVSIQKGCTNEDVAKLEEALRLARTLKGESRSILGKVVVSLLRAHEARLEDSQILDLGLPIARLDVNGDLPAGYSAQNVLEIKGICAQACVRLRQPDLALQFANDIASWENGYSNFAAVAAMDVFGSLGKRDNACRFIDHAYESLVLISFIPCLSQHKFLDLAYKSSRKAEEVIGREDSVIQQNRKNILKIAKTKLLMDEGNISRARLVLRQLFEDVKRTALPDFVPCEVTELICKLDMRAEGIRFYRLFRPKERPGRNMQNSIEGGLVKFLILEKRFDEARKIIEPEDEILDHRSGALVSAANLLSQIEHGKADANSWSY